MDGMGGFRERTRLGAFVLIAAELFPTWLLVVGKGGISLYCID